MNPVFQCEVCHYSRSVPDDYAGQKVRCPKCAGVAVVGTEPAPEAPEGDAARKPCPFCAEMILWEARKCRFCGEVIDRELAIAKERERIRVFERRKQIMHNYLTGARGSLVCGVLGVLLAPCLGPILSPVAILLALQASKELKQRPHLEGKGMARAGLILGILGLVVLIMFWVLWAPFMKQQQ